MTDVLPEHPAITASPAWTAGPWSVPHFAEPDVGCECGYVLTGGFCGAVATVHCSGEGNWLDTGDNPKFQEAVANAHLISAAPDMAEALEAFLALNQWENSCATPGKPTDDELDAIVALYLAKIALAKARGEQS